ncbi:AI-2E family transporter [Bacillus chungangensis]|uniref:PurR-regulated permease PerM n=1 Tax=Bacillus chungangensis TaxID=587633 RepID=A0ABT9WM08_9BACI|nr:AI-2E family transporter [Bacillus chungangensis]MDQ0174276.1 putative PurR-regulated permease PerM [Bacillus chungangensis]
MLKDNKFMQYLLFFFIALLLYKIVDNFNIVKEMFSYITSLLSPFIIAFSIAYMLKTLINWMEKKFQMNRAISILTLYTLLLGLSALSITVLTPKIVDSMTHLLVHLPTYVDQTNHWLTQNVLNNPLFERFHIADYIESNVQEFLDKTSYYVTLLLNKIASGFVSLTSAVFKFIFGIIISVYMLIDKEKFAARFSQLIAAFTKEHQTKKILAVTRQIDETFSKYLVGKIIDSIIFGLLSYIVLFLLNTPYTLLNAVILGVTNLIPYFGAIIGSIPAIVITLFVSPLHALWVGIAILALQQFHGLYLGPKILGNSVGLNPFWVFLAIIIGGGTYGALGMFLAVPVFSVLKTMMDAIIDQRLQAKKLLSNGQ